MKIWFNNVVDTERKVVEVTGNRVRIGRNKSNDIVLDSPYIADEAAVLYRRDGCWELVALGINGITLGDRQIYNGDRCQIRANQTIGLFPFTLTLDLPHEASESQDSLRETLDQEMSRVIADIHLKLLERMNLNVDSQRLQRENDEFLLTLERNLDAIAQANESFKANPALVNHIAGYGLRDRLLVDATQGSEAVETSELFTKRHWSRMMTAVPERELELKATADYMAKLLKLPTSGLDSKQIDAIDQGFWASWDLIRESVHAEFRRYLSLRYLKKEIKDIVFGYGPLEDLLRIPSITEIMVVGRDRIYVEGRGVLQKSGRRFVSDDVIEAIIQRIVGKVNRRIDKSQPLVDARLSDGSRVNAVIPPLAVGGPTLTIRKFPYRKILIDDLVAFGTLSRTVAEFLRAIVLNRRNIIVSGGTGTGKTTLLNCLSDFIPDRERIVTIEDTAELQLSKQHVVRMETKDANVEGVGQYTIRDLVRNALRMRPDRIVVGECRGPEALDMLQAMNTGHDGSLTTIHANSARDVLLRLEVLVQMAADLPVSSIHQQIGSAIDMVVQLQRQRDGRRVISQVSECVGVNPHTRQLELRDLYVRDQGEQGTLQPTGLLPSFIGELIETGGASVGLLLSRDDIMIPVITTLIAIAAGSLAGHSLVGAWDEFSGRFVADLYPMLSALSMDPEKYRGVLRWSGIACVTAVLLLGFALNMFPVAIVVTLFVFFAPRWILKTILVRRKALLRDQMVGAAIALSNASRAGLSLAQGLDSVSRETPEPLAAELRKIVSEYEHGRPLGLAIADAKNRLQLDSFTLFASAVGVSLERGGRITESLERIGQSLQENQRVERQLESETAGGRRVVWILAAFPFLFLAVFLVVHPSGTLLVFDSLVGQFILIAVIGLVYLSVWWSNRILAIEL